MSHLNGCLNDNLHYCRNRNQTKKKYDIHLAVRKKKRNDDMMMFATKNA